MHTIPNLGGLILFVLGCVAILLNWVAVYQNAQNRRRGVDRHVSGIGFMSLILQSLSAICFHTAQKPWLPFWLPLLAGVADIAIRWTLLVIPTLVARRRA